MRRVAAAVAILCVGSGATAQDIRDDPQRRRYVVPYVRTATDCIARQALQQQGIELVGTEDDLRSVLGGPMRQCADELDAMIAAHDRAYFPGAGEQFFRGPYLADLPRAVLRRIGPELVKRRGDVAPAQDRAPANPITPPAQEPSKRPPQSTTQSPSDRVAITPVLPIPPASPPASAPTPVPVPAPAPAPTVTPSPTIPRDTPLRVPTTVSPWTATAAASTPAITSGEATLLIVGGVLGLCLVLWMLSQGLTAANRRARFRALVEKYGDDETAHKIMAGMYWTGMTREMLIDSRGLPLATDQEVKQGSLIETFKYDQIGQGRFALRVTVDNNIVSGWKKLG